VVGARTSVAILRAEGRTRVVAVDDTAFGGVVRAIERGRVTVEFEVREEFKHPGGAVQGGIVTAYADLCMALAAHTHFEHGQHMSTSSLTLNFLAPVTAGPVIGEGTVVKKGRSVVFMEAVVRDREGNEYAHATSVGSIRARPA